MDKELRKEVRDWKAEVEDRLARLEAAQSAVDAQVSISVSQDGKAKKTAAEPTPGEKETN